MLHFQVDQQGNSTTNRDPREGIVGPIGAFCFYYIGSIFGCLGTTVDKSVEKLSGGGCGGPGVGLVVLGVVLVIVEVVESHYCY